MIPQQIINIAVPILKQHDAVHAGVFGSFARGEQTAKSDLDLMVEMPEGKSLLDLGGLYMDLKDALGIPVHLVTTRTNVHPLIKKNIDHDLVPIL